MSEIIKFKFEPGQKKKKKFIVVCEKHIVVACQNAIYLMCKFVQKYKFSKYPSAGHVITGNLKIIPDSRIRNIVSKGPKYRFPSQIGFNRCREEIASALNNFGNRWCKRESVSVML